MLQVLMGSCVVDALAALRNMIKTALILAVILLATFRGTAAAALALNPYESHTDAVARSEIDELVFARLERLHLAPACV